MERRVNAVAVLAEARSRGIVLVPRGAALRIGARDGALTPALHARILAHKPELVALLTAESASASEEYRRTELACWVEYVSQMARAHAYPAETIAVALDLLRRKPRACRFEVGRDAIALEMGQGMWVRVHREPQSWVDSTESGAKALSAGE